MNFVNVTLDKRRRISFSNVALYRMESLPRPFTFDDLGKAGPVSFGALVAWTWAMLSPDDARAFASPESLAPFVPLSASGARPLLEAIAETVRIAADSPDIQGRPTK